MESKMTDRLITFLIELDKDDALKQKYLSDPKGTAQAYGLTPEDVAICVNNDTQVMKARAEAEGADMITISHAK
jgi:hypothetical protein